MESNENGSPRPQTTESSPWLWLLMLVTLLQTSLFAMVTIYQYDNTGLLQEADRELDNRIKTLQEALTVNIMKRSLHAHKRADNFIADFLTSQEKIIAQHCIDKNKTCSKGEPGDPALPGVKGDKGQMGMLGDPGFPGSDGAKGQAGLRGDNGEPGLKGEQGLKGLKGSHGDVGPQGPKGEQGPRGSKGDSGIKGDKGDIGLRGDQGQKGDKGAQGEAGDPGDTGGRGQKGNKGDQGPSGPPGSDSSKDGCVCLQYPTFDDPTPTTQIYMAVGETINMPCNATGSPSPSISLKKQTTVPRRGRRSRDKRNFLILNGRYTITNAVTMDFGTYVCTATNGLGSVSKQIEIVKGVVPNIAKQPQSSTNNVGSTVQFRCVNTGVPTPTVTWYRNGKPIGADSRHQFSSNGEILTISNLQTTDSGTIECQASNAVGVTTSREAVLTVA